MIKEKIEDAKENAKRNLKTLIMDLAVILLSVVYTLYGSLVLSPNKEATITIVGRTIVGMVVGVLIKQALGENGFIRGYQCEDWITAKRSYGKKAEDALPYIDRIDDFYDSQRKKKLERNRRTKMASVRLRYETFFDENGNYIEHEIITPKQKEKAKKKGNQIPADFIVLDREQRKRLDKCIEMKIHLKNLFNEYETDLSSDEHREITDKDRRKGRLLKNAGSAVVISLIGVYFLPTWNWNLGAIISSLFQILTFVAVGVIQLYGNYSWVKNDRVAILKTKETELSIFLLEQQGREKFIENYNSKPKIEETKVVEEKPKEEEQIIELTQEEIDKIKGGK